MINNTTLQCCDGLKSNNVSELSTRNVTDLTININYKTPSTSHVRHLVRFSAVLQGFKHIPSSFEFWKAVWGLSTPFSSTCITLPKRRQRYREIASGDSWI